MEKDFEKIVEKAKLVSLSYDEKDNARHMIKTAIGLNDAHVIKHFGFFNVRFAAVALSALAIIGASVSYAAGDALPGDALYTVKNFNERISGLLAFSPEASAEWQVELADRRLSETEELNNAGVLDEDKRAVLEFKFETNANQFNKEIERLRSEKKFKKAGELSIKLESVIEKRRKIFSSMADNESKNDRSEIRVILDKVNLRSEQMIEQRQEIEKDALLNNENEINNGEDDNNAPEIINDLEHTENLNLKIKIGD